MAMFWGSLAAYGRTFEKKMRLRLIYGKDYLLFAIAINGITYFFLNKIGMESLTGLIWFKLIASGVGVYVHQKRTWQHIFFYMNNGLGKGHLLLSTILMDMFVWLSGFYLFFSLLS